MSYCMWCNYDLLFFYMYSMLLNNKKAGTTVSVTSGMKYVFVAMITCIYATRTIGMKSGISIIYMCQMTTWKIVNKAWKKLLSA